MARSSIDDSRWSLDLIPFKILSKMMGTWSFSFYSDWIWDVNLVNFSIFDKEYIIILESSSNISHFISSYYMSIAVYDPYVASPTTPLSSPEIIRIRSYDGKPHPIWSCCEKAEEISHQNIYKEYFH